MWWCNQIDLSLLVFTLWAPYFAKRASFPWHNSPIVCINPANFMPTFIHKQPSKNTKEYNLLCWPKVQTFRQLCIFLPDLQLVFAFGNWSYAIVTCFLNVFPLPDFWLERIQEEEQITAKGCVMSFWIASRVASYDKPTHIGCLMLQASEHG